MAGTNWHTFRPGQTISALQFNENFDWMEQDLDPMTGGTRTNNIADLGASGNAWRILYIKDPIQMSGFILGKPDGTTLTTTSGNLVVGTEKINGSTANIGGAGREIQSTTVSTPDFRTGAITVGTQSALGSLATGSTIATFLITTETNATVLIIGHVSIQIGASNPSVDISIDRGGTGLTGGRVSVTPFGADSNTSRIISASIHAVDTPAAGTYSYNLRYTINSGSFGSVNFYNFTAVEMKK